MIATIDLPRATIRMDQGEPAEPFDVYKRRGDLAIWMLEALPSLRPSRPEGAFYLFIDIERCTRDSRAFARRLLERYEVAAVPGAVLGIEGQLRFSLTVDEKQLREAMNRLLDCAASFP